MREAKVTRKTKETKIEIKLKIDGTGKSIIKTGVGFFDHMLESFAFHGKFDLIVDCKGDIFVDDHHTVEDVGIVLGQVFNKCLEDKAGIRRFSTQIIPMDESLSMVSVDISNRPLLVYKMEFTREKLGNMDTQNFKEFFKAFADASGITLHINLMYGENDHHKIESVFKGLGKALKDASYIEGEFVNSSKGVL